MRILRDFILVKVDKEYQDKITTRGGVELFVDTTFRPEWHVTMEGECVSIPEKLTDDILQNKGISPDVEVGDRVFFNYLCVSPENKMVIEDEVYYRVEYNNIFGYERGGKTLMIGGWVFVEPYVEDKEEKVGSIVIPEMLRKEQKDDMGKIINIGKPLAHEPDLGLKEGDMIVFSEIASFRHEIDGKKLYCMKQEYIMGKVNS